MNSDNIRSPTDDLVTFVLLFLKYLMIQVSLFNLSVFKHSENLIISLNCYIFTTNFITKNILLFKKTYQRIIY